MKTEHERRLVLASFAREILTSINQDNFLTVGENQDLEAKKLLIIIDRFLKVEKQEGK